MGAGMLAHLMVWYSLWLMSSFAGFAQPGGMFRLNRRGFDAASFLEEDADHVQSLPARVALGP